MARQFKSTNKKRKLGKLHIILLLLMALVAIGFMVMIIVVDAFPVSMTFAFLGVMFAVMVLTFVLFKRQRKWLRIIGILLAVIYIAIYGLGIYYLASTYAMFSRISADETSASVTSQSVDVTTNPFNVYITGIDQWNSEKGYDLERSDVNMIMTVNPQTRKILLTSIPRDTYVPLHRNGAMDKLTHTGIYGVDETLNTVSDWLGLDLNYYVKVNFTATAKVIYAIGGVDVESPKAFKSSISKYEYEKGMNHLDGREALFFARERKAFKGEDALRVENQQKVVKAMLDKVFSSSTLLTKYGDLLKIAADDLETNMSTDEMQALVKMQLADLSPWEINTQKITGEYDMDHVASLTQEQTFIVYKADPKSVEEVMSAIDKTMNPTTTEIAEATAKRQKNSITSFIKGLKK